MIRSTSGGLNSAITITRAPAASAEKLMLVPATWNSGMTISTVSSAR